MSLLDTVLQGDPERLALLAEAETADPHRLAEVHERLLTIGADSAPARAATILAGLGFDEAAQARPVAEFSGGWRMRVALATALFANPDLLLLDEPTNHLDLEATMWLEGWLARFPGAALVVSHDRGLLDRAVEAIAHLDKGKISLTPGGFDEFVRIRTERAMQQTRAAERVAAERAHIQSFIDRFRYKASKARQAQARIKALERLPQIEFGDRGRADPLQLSRTGAHRAADPGAGAGRYRLRHDQGAAQRLADRRYGRPDRAAGRQRQRQVDPGETAGRSAGAAGGRGAARAEAEGRLFRAASDRRTGAGRKTRSTTWRGRCRTRCRRSCGRNWRGLGWMPTGRRRRSPICPGGEKARLLLALATRDAPQLLILDEPTNHLDIDARDALVKALADFQGAVLLITHDPDLVELVADRLWLVADGTVKPFDGDLDDYRALLVERARPAAKAGAVTRKDDRRERAEARAALAPDAPTGAGGGEAHRPAGGGTGEDRGEAGRSGDLCAGANGEVTAANTRLAAIARKRGGRGGLAAGRGGAGGRLLTLLH